jgi:hypothetical protein
MGHEGLGRGGSWRLEMILPRSFRLIGFAAVVVVGFLGVSYAALLYFGCDTGENNLTSNNRGDIVSENFSSCFIAGDLDEFITLHRAYHWGRTKIVDFDAGPKMTGAKFQWVDNDHLVVDLGDADLYDRVEQVGSIHIVFKATGQMH